VVSDRDRRLTNTKNAAFTQVFGQIPKGTSATLLSGGLGRQLDGSNFWGKVSDVRGGVARRWGVSDDLTVGLGEIYDRNFQGLGELFWRPHGVPMQVSLSTLVGKSIDLNSTIDYQPTPHLNVNLSIRRGSHLNGRPIGMQWQLM
jgi:hypothetical protein